MNPVLMIPIAFVFGSIPFSFLVARAKGVDLREHGSGNPGATNLGRVLGRPYFFLGFALDMSKGLTPSLLTGWTLGTLGDMAVAPGDAWVWLGAMAASVLGHMYTPFLKFKGGKGVATGLGAMLGVLPALTIAGAGALVVFGVSLALWRMVGVASSLAAASLPLWVHLAFAHYETIQEKRVASQSQFSDAPASAIDQMVVNHAMPFIIVTSVMALLVIVKHRGNLARALKGQEPKIGERDTPPGGS